MSTKELKINVTALASAAWQIQTSQWNLSVISSHTYTLKFKARCSVDRLISAVVQKGDYSVGYIYDNPSLTSIMTQFIYSFVPTASDNTVTVEFDFGNHGTALATHDIYLDDVEFYDNANGTNLLIDGSFEVGTWGYWVDTGGGASATFSLSDIAGANYALTLNCANNASGKTIKNTQKNINFVSTMQNVTSKSIKKYINPMSLVSLIIKKQAKKSMLTNVMIVANIIKLMQKVIPVISTISSTAVKQIKKNLNNSTSQFANISKSAKKIVTAINTAMQSVLKTTTKSIYASLGFICSVVAQILTGLQTFYINISATITTTSTLRKSTNKNVTSVISVQGILRKNINKKITATVLLALSLTKIVYKGISTVSTSVSSLRKNINKTVLTSSASVYIVTKSIAKTIINSAMASTSIIKEIFTGFITYYLEVATETKWGSSIGKFVDKVVNSSITISSAYNKFITKAINIISTMTYSLIKQSGNIGDAMVFFIANVKNKLFSGSIRKEFDSKNRGEPQ